MDMKKVARKLIQGEVAEAESIGLDEGHLAGYWAGLVEQILDRFPKAAEAVIEYLVGDE